MTSDISSDITGFSLPIFSLEGMKETKRLKNPSLADCMVGGYEYSLLAPYISTTTYTTDIGEAGSSSYTCTV